MQNRLNHSDEKTRDKELISIGLRGRKLRSLVHISLENLGKLLFVDRRTLSKFEAGEGFSDYTVLQMSRFYAMTISQFTNVELPYMNAVEFREMLIEYHRIDRPEYTELLERPMTFPEVIEFKIANSEYLDEPRTVGEITSWVEREEIFKITNENVSRDLEAAFHLNLIDRKKHNGRNFSYFNIKQPPADS